MSTLREILAEAGFQGHGLDMAVAVSLAESGGNPLAHNGNAGTGDNSYGLFQINMLGSMGPARLAEFGLTSPDQLFDPLTNAKAAYRISAGGTNWQPWSTFTNGAYEAHLGQDPTTELAGAGPVTGTAATGASSAVGSTTAPDYDQIDTGRTLTASSAQQDLAVHASSQHDDLVAGMQQALGLPAMATDVTGVQIGSSVFANGVSADTVTTGRAATEHTHLEEFLDAAVAQRGDPYVFGAKGAPNDPNPTAFDCSGLTQWAAHQGGYDLPAGAAHQYLALRNAGMLIPVSEAENTPGALLFHFASEPQPGQGEPEVAHVAISLGNQRTIEAANPQDGVNEFGSGGGRFNYAAVIPGISDSVLHGSATSDVTLASAVTTPAVTTATATSQPQTDVVSELAGALGLGHVTSPHFDTGADSGEHDLGTGGEHGIADALGH